MGYWVSWWARRVALLGGCGSLVVGVLLGYRVPTVCLLSLSVAVALYLTVQVFGRVIGATILRAAIRDQLRREDPDEGSRAARERKEVNTPAA